MSTGTCLNTWQSAHRFYDFNLKANPALVDDLEKAWVAAMATNTLSELYDLSAIERDFLTPLDAYDGLLDIGLYPPPIVTLLYREIRRTYVMGAGRFDYDMLINGEQEPGSGNVAARKMRELAYELFDDYSYFHTRAQEMMGLKVLQKSLILSFLEEHQLPISPDTFRKGFSNWKKQQKQADL
ncbi:hypothetical protein [Amphritea balenae]|uniref:Uncharacterized protein n=1 Tax=Amphritea balenae TaxID=452629 RepID=A0A3P1SVV8_9GAMM|nr:hypothetical protein [Amphritea balenae]RRD01329.1 hypothetical protein EHS89_01850 [Amphritea balenae]GGK58043.1 hypothetical protein GCM10007941_05250 [Amphritea balenae]